MPRLYDVVVLIPCFTEEQTVTKVISDFKTVIPGTTIFVYDNNSSDTSVVCAQNAGAVVRHEYQQGKGNVIRRMFAEVDAKCYVLVDGDDTYPAEAAKEMANLILKKKADMVVGDRLSSTYFSENKRMFHGFGNNLVRWCINLLFDNNIKDIMTGYRAFSYRFVKTYPVLSKGFEIETEMSIHAVDKNMPIDNVVVDYRDRPNGSKSKLSTYSDGIKILMTIQKLFRTYRPEAYFGLIALALLITSTAFLLPVLADYRRTGLVERFPTLIVCGFVMIAALFSFFAWQLLKTINQKSKQNFEIELIRATDRLHDLTINNNVEFVEDTKDCDFNE